MTATHQRVVTKIYEVCKPDKPDLTDADKSLLADDLDSLDFASVLMAIEDEFGLSLQDANVEELNTLNKLVAYVDCHKKS